MAIEFVQAGVSTVAATSTRTVTLNGVTAGNLIVAVVFWEGPTTTVSVSDGTSSFTVGNAGVNPDTIDDYWDIRQCVAYLLSANSGNKTYTLTLGAARQTVALHVLEFSGDHDWSLDGQASYGYGRGTTETSGSLTTTGTNVVCVGWGRMWTSGGYSSQTIGDRRRPRQPTTEDIPVTPPTASPRCRPALLWLRLRTSTGSRALLHSTLMEGAATPTTTTRNSEDGE